MDNYYITLDDGFTYGPYDGKLAALLGGLNYYGMEVKLTYQEKSSLQDVEFYATSLWKGGNTIVVYSEIELKDKQEEIYYECDIYKQQSLESFINEFFNTCIESPIY